MDAAIRHELEQLSARVGVESAGVVDVENGFLPDEIGAEIVAADDAGAEVGEERGGGRKVVFSIALVDFGWSLWTVDIALILDIQIYMRLGVVYIEHSPALTVTILPLVATTARLLLLMLTDFLADTPCYLDQLIVPLLFVGIRQQTIPVVRIDVEEHRAAKV